jgi:hypothetical protein
MPRDTNPVAVGRTVELAEARRHAEAALAQVTDRRGLPSDRSGYDA